MTRNQQRAVQLADAILEHKIRASDVPDPEWQLLLLAAGLENSSSMPVLVAYLVRHNLAQKSGYFASAKSIGPLPKADSARIAPSFSA
jgi:hypothetical protein